MTHGSRQDRARALALALSLVALFGGVSTSPAQENPLDFTISLKNRTIGPDCGVDPDFVQAILQSENPVTRGIVQLRSLPRRSADGQELDDVQVLDRLGISLLAYLNGRAGTGTAYLAAIRNDFQVDDPRFEELVRCLVPLVPEDKLETELVLVETPATRAATSVLVRFFDLVPTETAESLLRELGLEPISHGESLWEVLAAADQIQSLASLDAVQWVQPGPLPLLPTVDETRSVSHVDEVQQLNPASGVYGGLSGAGVQIAIMDTGVDTAHDDFAGRFVRSQDDGGDHGSHVAGIAAGSGVRSDQTNDDGVGNGGTAYQWRGMAPEAGIAAYGTAGGNSAVFQDAIVANKVDVSNHSYVLQVQNQYDAAVQAVDRIIRGDVSGVPSRLAVWAAANNASVDPRPCPGGGSYPQYPDGCPTAFKAGYFSILSPCKNCLNVGAIEKNMTHAGFSSLGPTSDGRLKPDIAAVGSSVTSVGANTNRDGIAVTGNGYRVKGGTSMAAPAVTGIAALMLEQYAATFGVDIDVAPPLPSTLKAILIQSADDLAGTDPTINFDTGAAVTYGVGPDWATGYGVANAEEAVRIVAAGSSAFLEDVLNPSIPFRDHAFTVAPGQREVRVTLAWDDRAGTPNANDGARQLVNDLDLVVIDADGASHRPLVLPSVVPRDCDANAANGIQVGTCSGPDDGTQNFFGPAAPGVDRLNNVEQVVVTDTAPLPAGGWTARVSVLDADGVTVRMPLGGDQDYSLVVRTPNRPPQAVCAAAPVVKVADGACCAVVAAAEADGGSFDPNGDADIADRCITRSDGSPIACAPSVLLCGAGSHSVELTVTDQAGEASACTATVRIVDETPPAITCPDDATLECPSNTDPSETGVATAIDNCSTPTIGHEDAVEPGCGGTVTITRTWTATDAAGNAASCAQTVRTIDTTPPAVACNVENDEVWPPNHKLRDIGFSFTAIDACDPAPPVAVVGVTSDEHPAFALGSGGQIHCPDAVVEDGAVLLRGERAGNGDGRVYVVRVAATDACGNVGHCEKSVVVPKAQGGPNSGAVDSGQSFDATVCGASEPTKVKTAATSGPRSDRRPRGR